jgi:hypothetical protein
MSTGLAQIPESWQDPKQFIPATYYMVVQRMMGAWRPFFRDRRTVELHLSVPAAEAQLAIAARIYGADRVRIATLSTSLDGLLPLHGLPSQEDLDAVAAEATAKANTAPDSTPANKEHNHVR